MPHDWTAERLDLLPVGTVIQTHYRIVRADTWTFEVKDDDGHWISDIGDAATSAEIAENARAIDVFSLPLEYLRCHTALCAAAAAISPGTVPSSFAAQQVIDAAIESVPGVTP